MATISFYPLEDRRALVSVDALDRPADRPGAMPPDSPAAGPDGLIRQVTAAIEPMVALLRDQIEHERGRADRAEARAGQAERDLAAERNRADQREVETAVMRQVVDQAGSDVKEARTAQARAEQAATELQDRLESELEAVQLAKADAEADAEELRRAEAVRAGQGRWARLRGGVAGK